VNDLQESADRKAFVRNRKCRIGSESLAEAAFGIARTEGDGLVFGRDKLPYRSGHEFEPPAAKCKPDR
jgi:hypothetical protein